MMSTLSRADRLYVAKLRGMSQVILGQVLGSASDVVLAGVPNHRNLGDSMISAGTLAHLDQLGVHVASVLDPNFSLSRHLEDLKKLPPELPILLNGGGNLGDLYPHEEKFRQEVFSAMPGRRFVIMPQTVHFVTPHAAERSRQVYAQVRNLTVMVRERRSEALARELYPSAEVVWSPDHALGWTPKLSRAAVSESVVIVARSDSESRDAGHPDLPDWEVSWANAMSWSAVTRVALRCRHLPGSLHMKSAPTRLSRLQLRVNLRAAERLASKANIIATNRLHAHVLAALSGREHFVTDNSYGKIGRIFDEYSGEFGTANWVPSLEIAVEKARRATGR